MEDENGIELSLCLSCGGSAGKSKSKDGGSSDSKTNEEGSNNKLEGDLKFFFHTDIQEQDIANDPQKNELVNTQENLFTSLPKSDADTSMDLHVNNGLQFTRYGGPWVANSERSAEIEEKKFDHHEIGGKRKMSLEEINHQKKHESEVQYLDAHGKNPPMADFPVVKTSHVSLIIEGGSSAEKEDVAESEVEGSTSRQILHHEDGIRRYMCSGGSSEFPNDKQGLTQPSVTDVQDQKQSNVLRGNGYKPGNLTYEIPFSLQPCTVKTALHSLPVKVPNSVGVPSKSGFPGSCVMQLMPSANNERLGGQPTNSGSLPLTFGYSQFPQAVVQVPSQSSSETGKASENTKGGGKHTTEDGDISSTSQIGDVIKGNGVIVRPKEVSDQSTVDGFSSEGSAIMPGIAASLKFGGCGSYPDLPWVSATSPGPNGRTISGVTYRYNKTQIKIVCACHGSHMSTEEFIQHASSDHHNPGSNTGFVSFTNDNPAALAQS